MGGRTGTITSVGNRREKLRGRPSGPRAHWAHIWANVKAARWHGLSVAAYANIWRCVLGVFFVSFFFFFFFEPTLEMLEDGTLQPSTHHPRGGNVIRVLFILYATVAGAALLGFYKAVLATGWEGVFRVLYTERSCRLALSGGVCRCEGFFPSVR